MVSSSHDSVSLIDVSDPSSPVTVGTRTDDAVGFTELNGARGVATFVAGSSVYAIVAGYHDHGTDRNLEPDLNVHLAPRVQLEPAVAFAVASGV